MPLHDLNGVRIVVGEQVKEYRAAGKKELRRSDIILELGCHDGTSCALLRPFCKRAVGLDKGAGHIEAAKMAFRDVEGLEFVQSVLFFTPSRQTSVVLFY